MNWNWSIVIAAIALVVSVLSPIFTAILNNRYQLKLKRIEFNLQHRAEVIEGYIRTAGKATKSPTYENISDFGKYANEIYLYLDDSFWPYLDTINNSLIFDNFIYETAYQNLQILTKKLSNSSVRPKI